MRPRESGIATLACLLLAAGPVLAAPPLTTNRPGEADPPYVVGAGFLQLEGGVQLDHETQGSPNTNTLTVPQLQFRLGLFRNFEFRLRPPEFMQRWREDASDQTGIGDLGLALKIFLWNQARLLPTTAVQLGMSVDTGSDAFTSDGLDPELRILYEWDFRERYTLTGNFDFSSRSPGVDKSGRYFRFDPKLAFGISLTDRLAMFVEYYGAINDNGVSDEHSVDGGFTWLVNDNVQLDLSAGKGLNEAATDVFVSSGFVWRLPRLWTPKHGAGAR